MTPIVADTGPLIALARTGRLELLHRLFRHIIIPPAVHEELAIGSGRPGATALAGALAAKWISVESVASRRVALELAQLLDNGEAEAIALAEQLDARFLLIDELAGRKIARRRGVSVTGVAGVLLSAKASGAVVAVQANPPGVVGGRISPVVQAPGERAAESRRVSWPATRSGNC